MVMVLGADKERRTGSGSSSECRSRRHTAAAKKRFKVTGTGKLLRRHAMKSHNLEKKSAKRQAAAFRRGRSRRRAERRASAGGSSWEEEGDAARQAIRPRAQEAPQGARAGEGLLGPEARSRYRKAKEQVEQVADVYAYRDRKNEEADVPAALDHPHQRGRAPARGSPTTSSSPAAARRRSSSTARCSPTSPCSDPAAFGEDRRAGEGRARGLSRRLSGESRARGLVDKGAIFRRQAEQFEALGSPVYAHLARRCVAEPLVDELVGRAQLGRSPAALRRRALPRARGDRAVCALRRVGRLPCSPGCTARLPRTLRARAGGTDERGAAVLRAAARVPAAGRRARRLGPRPGRARPLGGAESALGPLRATVTGSGGGAART